MFLACLAGLGFPVVFSVVRTCESCRGDGGSFFSHRRIGGTTDGIFLVSTIVFIINMLDDNTKPVPPSATGEHAGATNGRLQEEHKDMAVSKAHHGAEERDVKQKNGTRSAQKQGTGDEQYFTANPQSADVRRERKVTLRGYDATVQTSNGVFSGNRVDLGTSVLLRHAPMPPQQGTGLDLGCGWGPIALALGFESPNLDIWAIDINERAVDLTAENAKSNGLEHVHAVTSDAVPANLTFDVIWSNPPIRIGKDALHELLMAWLPRLNPGGAAYLVVQKNLGSDSLIPWLAQALGDGYSVSKYASSKGYRVIEVLRQA